jgi:hypothetical protein
MWDVEAICRQTKLIPLPSHRSAIEGILPLSVVLPDAVPGAGFRSDGIYYRNYQYKIKGGALFFRDLHPDSYQLAAWAMLAIGALAIRRRAAPSHQQVEKRFPANAGTSTNMRQLQFALKFVF